jgi:hypothetical protein
LIKDLHHAAPRIVISSLWRRAAWALFPSFSERLTKVEQMTGNIGWGFHDFIADVVRQPEDEPGEP